MSDKQDYQNCPIDPSNIVYMRLTTKKNLLGKYFLCGLTCSLFYLCVTYRFWVVRGYGDTYKILYFDGTEYG